jgi:secreted Zn-dependent insulinase-like peptidase
MAGQIYRPMEEKEEETMESKDLAGHREGFRQELRAKVSEVRQDQSRSYREDLRSCKLRLHRQESLIAALFLLMAILLIWIFLLHLGNYQRNNLIAQLCREMLQLRQGLQQKQGG